MTRLQTRNYIDTRNVIMRAIQSAQPVGQTVFIITATRDHQHVELRRMSWSDAEVTRAQLSTRGFAVKVDEVS